MGSGAMIYIPSSIMTGEDIQKLLGGKPQIHRQHEDHISLLSFLQNKENRLKTKSRSTAVTVVSAILETESNHVLSQSKYP
jgi:hypothetical protein